MVGNIKTVGRLNLEAINASGCADAGEAFHARGADGANAHGAASDDCATARNFLPNTTVGSC